MMFTGIVTDIGMILGAVGADEREFEIAAPFEPQGVALGASISHSGVCLTVADRTDRGYLVKASAETLARTTLRRWAPGQEINLERSLRLGDELGGHLVFGHVDAVGIILAIEPEGESRSFRIGIPPELAPMLAVKGSVAVDGISLTVTQADHDAFSVVVIPHSFAVTTLAGRRIGDEVNLEMDMLARYVARQLGFASERLRHAR
jgi:riboflavin synthase